MAKIAEFERRSPPRREMRPLAEAENVTAESIIEQALKRLTRSH